MSPLFSNSGRECICIGGRIRKDVIYQNLCSLTNRPGISSLVPAGFGHDGASYYTFYEARSYNDHQTWRSIYSALTQSHHWEYKMMQDILASYISQQSDWWPYSTNPTHLISLVSQTSLCGDFRWLRIEYGHSASYRVKNCSPRVPATSIYTNPNPMS
jgi:hypothetical protein